MPESTRRPPRASVNGITQPDVRISLDLPTGYALPPGPLSFDPDESAALYAVVTALLDRRRPPPQLVDAEPISLERWRARRDCPLWNRS